MVSLDDSFLPSDGHWTPSLLSHIAGRINICWLVCSNCQWFFRHSRFFDILYKNMPLSFLSVMTNGKGEIVYTTSSLCLMAFSHVLDTFLHPGVTYLLWRAHCRSGGSLQSIITWPLLISTFLMSRFWSIFHIYYNYRRLGLYYIGDDIYKLNNQDAYIYAYTAEGIFFLMLACSKILKRSDKEI